MKSITFTHLDFQKQKTKDESKHAYEFQEICSELESIYGKAVWRIPFQKNMTEWKMREAHRIATQRGIYTYPYFYGILKRLP